MRTQPDPWSRAALPKRDYAIALDNVRRNELSAVRWQADWGPMTPENLNRRAHNILTARKVWELPDYGRLADLRELIALRIAPWLAR